MVMLLSSKNAALPIKKSISIWKSVNMRSRATNQAIGLLLGFGFELEMPTLSGDHE